MSWEIKQLPEVASFELGKMLDKAKNKGELRPYLANLNVRWGQFELNDLREMRFTDKENDRYSLKHGDIVMCEGGEPGRCAYWKNEIPGMMFQKALHRIRALNCIDSKYLFYSLFNIGIRGELSSLFTGATIKHLPREQLSRIEIPFPPLPIQKRIAGILSAYDDLIAVNERRIAILEEMARRVFEEWFVKFRFSGNQFKNSGDNLPKGWSRETLEFASNNFDRLRKPLSKMQRSIRQGPYPYFGAAKIFDYIDNYIFDGKYLMIAEDGSVATKDGFPVLQFFEGKFWANNHTHILTGRDRFSTEYLYLALQFQPIMQFVTGAAQPKITQANLNKIDLIKAPESVHQKFDFIVEPILNSVRNFERQNTNLRATRDLLLPRLISGEIDVLQMPDASNSLLVAE